MAQQKSKKISTAWILCEKCSITLLNKDIEKHLNDCPPNINSDYNFIKNETLFGVLDHKIIEEVKHLSSREVDNLVFLSQPVIQMCSLSIGEWCLIKLNDNKYPPVAKIVWPTTEKTLTSVLFSKNSLDLSFGEINKCVQVSKVPYIKLAKSVQIVVLNCTKILELNSELYNRISKSHSGHILTVGNKIYIMFYGKVLKFEIKSIEAEKGDSDLEVAFQQLHFKDENYQFFKITDSTKWKIYRNEESFLTDTQQTPYTSYMSGVDDEVNEIREIMQTYFQKSTILSSCQTRSVLLYGNSGTGKTTIAQALAEESKATIITLFASDIYSKKSNSTEEFIKERFQEAIDQSPSVIIIDEIDILCPVRTTRLTDSDKRIVSTFLLMIDNLKNQKGTKVFIIATCNKLDNIDPAFRRCERLDREIEIPTPSPKNRKAILTTLLRRSPIKLSETDLQEIAMITHGFVGADLVSLCSQANLNFVVRKDTAITVEDFRCALRKIKPSAMREVQVEVPSVKWSDIGGQHNLKLILKQSVEWPLKYPESFKRLGIDPPRGVLMFGPPGCSKTMIAKALATESGLNFLSIKGPELFSKWVGESERAVREVFRKAAQVAPSIIFFDEIDALGGERTSGSSTSVQERVLAQLLTELDGITPLGDVTIIAATNRPDRIDKALLRPGRLDRIVYVPLPDHETRKEIFEIKFSKMPVHNVNVGDLIQATDGYSGAEVNAVCHEAAMAALEENLDVQFVESRHFEKAMKLITPRTPSSLITLYEEYTKNKNYG